MNDTKNLRVYSQFLIFFGLLVILWGAWVRISHSGDGCGNHWPLCQGSAIPLEANSKTWTEYFHRITSGLFGLAVVGQFLWVKRHIAHKHPARIMSVLAVIFLITEALLGAGLVKLGLVASDDSLLRPFVMSLHLINSLILIGSLTLVWDFLGAHNWVRGFASQGKLIPGLAKKLKIALLFGFAIIAVTGAIAALSTTLFPSASLWSGLMQDFNPGSHYLIKARFLHPFLGVLLGGSIALTTGLSLKLWPKTDLLLRARSRFAAYSTLAGIVVGIMTLTSLSALPMKIAHLLIAYLIWIAIVLWIRAISFRPAN